MADISAEQSEQREEWWRQYAIIGQTAESIAKKDKANGLPTTIADVQEGLESFAEYLGSSMTRSSILAKHKSFIASMRATSWRHLQLLQKKIADSGGVGIKDEQVIEEFRGNKLVSRKIKSRWRSPVNELSTLQRLALEFDRYEALLDGLLAQPESNIAPDQIEIHIPGLAENIFTHPDDAPDFSRSAARAPESQSDGDDE